jgi:glycosyltransferase involved in cell wall biosynthesis
VSDATLNGPVLARSEAVIVHSASSWLRVRDAADVPVFRVPLGVPAIEPQSQADARRSLGIPSSEFVIATLGDVTASRGLDRVLGAIAMLPADLRARTTFLVVGAAMPPVATDLTAQAIRSGIGQRVRFTGRVSLEELGTFGCAADVCVQLRYPVRGETSAALLRALAAGSACIVSDAGSFSEVPEDVAPRVTPDDREVANLCALFVRVNADPGLGRQLRERAVAWIRGVHTMENAGRLYSAAMMLTIARRRAIDGEWIDATSAALNEATAALTEATAAHEPDSELFGRWAEMRRRATAIR